MINIKTRDPSLSDALGHCLGSLFQNGNWYQVHQQTRLQKTISEPSRDSISKPSTPNSSVAGCLGFWTMPFGCTCWTLNLSSHVTRTTAFSTILIVKRLFVRHHLVNPNTFWVMFILPSLPEGKQVTFDSCQVRQRLCHWVNLWCVTWESNKYTRFLCEKEFCHFRTTRDDG